VKTRIIPKPQDFALIFFIGHEFLMRGREDLRLVDCGLDF